MRKIVILVSGKLQSGKNTFADFLKEEIETQYKTPVAIDFFAKLLKDMCKDGFRPLTDHLNAIFGSLKMPLLVTNDENWYENKNEITRHILQIVGTEIVRKVNPLFWIDSFKARADEREESVTICSDVRFPNEISRVDGDFDIVKIRVERRRIVREGSINEHASETALDDYGNWDYMVINDGTLEELKVEVKRIAKDLSGFGFFNRS